jgi:hypothetical protein
MNTSRVSRLTESDWRAFAELRLQALHDSLGPHDPQLLQESSFTAAQWRRRLRAHAQFAALVDDRPVGLIGAQRQHADSVYLYSLWLEPSARDSASFWYRLRWAGRAHSESEPSRCE